MSVVTVDRPRHQQRHRWLHYGATGEPRRQLSGPQAASEAARLTADGHPSKPVLCDVCGWWHLGTAPARASVPVKRDDALQSELGWRIVAALSSENTHAPSGRRRTIRARCEGRRT